MRAEAVDRLETLLAKMAGGEAAREPSDSHQLLYCSKISPFSLMFSGSSISWSSQIHTSTAFPNTDRKAPHRFPLLSVTTSRASRPNWAVVDAYMFRIKFSPAVIGASCLSLKVWKLSLLRCSQRCNAVHASEICCSTRCNSSSGDQYCPW